MRTSQSMKKILPVLLVSVCVFVWIYNVQQDDQAEKQALQRIKLLNDTLHTRLKDGLMREKLLRTIPPGVQPQVNTPNVKVQTDNPATTTKPISTTKTVISTLQSKTNPSVTTGSQVKSDQTTTAIPTIKPAAQNAQNDSNSVSTTYVTLDARGGRLGSTMFGLACLYGIAVKNNKQPYLLSSFDLTKRIQASHVTDIVPVRDSKPPGDEITISETAQTTKGPHSVGETILNLPKDKNVKIHGYIQAYGYFAHVADKVRKEMWKFKEQTLIECKKKLREVLQIPEGALAPCTIVGVHCRRADFTSFTAFGHWPAQPEYVRRAIQYYWKRYMKNENMKNLTKSCKTEVSISEKPTPTESKAHFQENSRFSEPGPMNSKCARFLILGDDPAWNKQQFGNLSDVVIPETKRSADVDMCMLGSANHSIISTGTYSWWSGFLAGGHVVFQREYARPGSQLWQQYTPSDYFPPGWEPI